MTIYLYNPQFLPKELNNLDFSVLESKDCYFLDAWKLEVERVIKDIQSNNEYLENKFAEISKKGEEYKVLNWYNMENCIKKTNNLLFSQINESNEYCLYHWAEYETIICEDKKFITDIDSMNYTEDFYNYLVELKDKYNEKGKKLIIFNTILYSWDKFYPVITYYGNNN